MIYALGSTTDGPWQARRAPQNTAEELLAYKGISRPYSQAKLDYILSLDHLS